MKRFNLIVIISFILIISKVTGFSQDNYCQNLDFEQGDFTNWVAYSWFHSTMFDHNSDPVEGFVYRRHTIMTDTSAYDPNTGNELKCIPAGYRFSARLGDGKREGDVSPRNWNQILRYTLSVDQNNTLLVLKFAVVLEYDPDHQTNEEPRFCMTLFDESGDTLPDCANYDVYASNSNIKGFHHFDIVGGDETINWRDWTTVGVDLTKYLGKNITIEFRTADCTLGFDYGYAYFVASCQPLKIGLKYCTNDSIARLTAPEGFESYSWKNSYGTEVDTSQLYAIAVPHEGATYTCTMHSATGCDVTLQSTVHKYLPHVNFGSYMLDCFSNTVQLTDSSTSNQGTLQYFWDFGDGGKSNEKNPEYTFVASGMHTVTLGVVNSPSVCSDILTKQVESFSPPLVYITGDTTYCPGESVYIKATGAYRYDWSNRTHADSVEIGAPGGTYWMVGHSSDSCISDTNYVTISEEPDWLFSKAGDTVLCVGESSYLSVSGGVSHLWNTGSTNDSLLVDTADIYYCTGANKRGCFKTNTFNVVEIPPPGVNFILSDYTLHGRNNILKGNVPEQDDVQYTWDMGDSISESGPAIQHAYNISNGKLSYIITLRAVDMFGCTNSNSDIIDVIPFVPNVFTPNGDGINDVFMPDIDLQVFDRNGQVLYKGFNGWDGYFKGQPADPDTYFYAVFYTNRFNQKQTKKGYVTLIR